MDLKPNLYKIWSVLQYYRKQFQDNTEKIMSVLWA